MPNKALVPPIPADEAVATPSTIANLPISILEDAWPPSPTPTAEFAGIFSPVDPLAMLNLRVKLLYETSTPYALWVSAAIWSPVNKTDSAFNNAPPPIFDEALLLWVFKPIAFALFPSPGAKAEKENILLAVDVPILDGIPCKVKFCPEESYVIFKAGSASSTQSSVIEISWKISASSLCDAAVVPAAPLVRPVNEVAVFPVYANTSVPILINPESSKPVVESTVTLVTVSFIAPFTSVVLFSSPIVSILVTRLTSARRSISKSSLAIAGVVPLAPLVIPLKTRETPSLVAKGLVVVVVVQPV